MPTTTRHNKCLLLVPDDKQGPRCSECVIYRTTLTVQAGRLQNAAEVGPHHPVTPASGISFSSLRCTVHEQYTFCNRYQPIPALVDRFQQLRHEHNTLKKLLQRLKAKIKESTEACGVTLHQPTHDDLAQIISSQDCRTEFENLPKDSFQRIFWEQQMEALAKNPKNMRWHPLMIRLCLYVKHR